MITVSEGKMLIIYILFKLFSTATTSNATTSTVCLLYGVLIQKLNTTCLEHLKNETSETFKIESASLANKYFEVGDTLKASCPNKGNTYRRGEV